MFEPDVVIAPEPTAGPLTAVRGMLLMSSRDELKALGYYPRYAELLGPERLAELEAYPSNAWVPVDSMRAHYRSCDLLYLTPHQLDEMGGRVGGRLQGPMLAAVSKTVRIAGFDPWSAVKPLFRMSARVFQGSTVRVRKVGPKDLEATIYGNALCEYIYFRVAFCGVLRGVFRFVGARAPRAAIGHVSVQRGDLTVRVSWV